MRLSNGKQKLILKFPSFPAASGIAKVIGGVQVLPSGAIGPGGRAAVLRDPNVTSPTDSSGPTTSDGPGVATSVAAAHPYAKVKKEHPYAHVKLPKSECVQRAGEGNRFGD